MDSASRARLQVLAAALLFSTGGVAIKACGLTGWQVAAFRSGTAPHIVQVAASCELRRHRSAPDGTPCEQCGPWWRTPLVLKLG